MSKMDQQFGALIQSVDNRIDNKLSTLNSVLTEGLSKSQKRLDRVEEQINLLTQQTQGSSNDMPIMESMNSKIECLKFDLEDTKNRLNTFDTRLNAARQRSLENNNEIPFFGTEPTLVGSLEPFDGFE